MRIFKDKFPKKSLKKHRRNRKKNFYRNPWRNLWWINGKPTGTIYVGIMGETSEVTPTRILKGIPSGNSKMVSQKNSPGLPPEMLNGVL